MKIFLPFIFFCLLTFSVNSQEKKEFKIGILVEYKSPEFYRFLDKFEQEVSALAGETSKVVIPQELIISTNYESDKVVSGYEALEAAGADIILISGITVFNEAQKHRTVKTPTVLFGFYDLELVGIDPLQTTSGIDNFSYVVLSQTYEEDLTKFKTLFDFNNIGIVIEKNIYDFANPDTFARPIFEKLGVNYTYIPFESKDDILHQLEGVDAVYFANGFLLQGEEMHFIADELIKRKLPSFTSTSLNHVGQGILATNKKLENNEQFVRRLGLMVEEVMNGTNLSEAPIYSKFETELTLNISTARKIGIPINLGLIASTNFVGDFDTSTADKKYDLLGVMQQAIESNLGLAASRKNVELATQDIAASKSNYLPNVTASATANFIDEDLASASNGGNPENQTIGSLSLTQTIYSEAATAGISIQKSLAKAEEANLSSDQLAVVYDAMQAYYQALALKSNLQVRYTNLQLTKKNLQVAEQNYEAGQAGKSDVLRFRSERANNTQVLLEGVSNLQIGFNALNFILNNDPDLTIDIEDVSLDDERFSVYRYKKFLRYIDNPALRGTFVDFLYEEAMQNNPDLKAIDYNLEALNRSISLYGSGRFVPTIGLKGQYNYEFSRSGSGTEFPPGFTVPPDNYYTVGLNVSIPLIDQNLKNINKRTSMIQADQLQLQKDEFTLNLRQNIENIILEIVNQISNIEISEVTLEAAEESLDLVQTSYAAGAVTVVELLDSQNNYLQAKLSKVNATYEYLLAVSELERIGGMFILLNSETQNQAFIDRFNTFIQNKN